jgi:hypothetical protein
MSVLTGATGGIGSEVFNSILKLVPNAKSKNRKFKDCLFPLFGKRKPVVFLLVFLVEWLDPVDVQQR